jgi:hypothetical protein
MMATPDINTAFSPENINALVSGINSGQISRSQVPAHVQSELSNRGVQFSDQYDFTEEDTPMEFNFDDMRRGTQVRSTAAQGDQFIQAIGLRAHVAGSDIFDEVLNFMINQEYQVDGQASRDVAANEVKQQMIQDNQEYIRSYIADTEEGNEEIYQLAQDVNFNNQEITLRHPTSLWLDLYADEGTDEQVRQRLVGQTELAQMLKDIADEMGILDKVLGVGASILPFHESYQAWDESGSIFDAEQWVFDLAERVRSADPEIRDAAILSLREDILPDMPELRQIALLEALMAPEGAENTLDWHWLNPALDIVGVLTGTTMARAANATRRAVANARAPKVLKEAGNREAAGETVAGAIVTRSEEAMAATNGDALGAIATASPFRTQALMPDSVDGISVETIRSIDTFTENLQTRLKEIVQGEVIPLESFLSERNIMMIHDDILRKYQKKVGIDNVEISRQGNTFSIRYDEIDEAGEVMTAGRVDTYTASLDDLGSFNLGDLSLMDRYFHSPLAAFKGTDLEREARIAQRMDSFQAKLLNEFRDLHREALRPIIGNFAWKTLTPAGRRRLEELEAVLMKGNLNKEVYTPSQLSSGELGFTLDDAQIESYFNVRSLMDGLHYVRNAVKRNELDIKGLKNLNLEDGSQQIVRPYADQAAASSSLRASTHTRVHDAETGRVLHKDDIDLEEAYANNKRLVAYEEATDVGADTKVYYSLVNMDQVTDLPTEVINYVPGYIPQISKDAVYFVKMRTATSIDGRSISATNDASDIITVREFDNRADAELFAHQQNLQLRQQGVTDEQKNFLALQDSQLERERSASGMGESFSGGGGLYTGKRADQEILFGLEGRPREMVNSFEAISRNLATLAKYVPRNEWRMGMERQAINTANRLLRAEGGSRFKSFEDLRAAPDTDEGKVIKSMYTQIRDWTGMPTSTELAFQDMNRRLIDTAFGRKMPGAKRMLLNVRQSDPIGAARATAFHSLLGWFNPRQLWIQAQGLAVAASMNILRPDQLALVIRDQTALQMLQHMRGTPKQIAHVAKATGMDKNYLEKMYAAWKRSGLQDSVLTNADHAAAASGHGIAMDALSRAADQGLFFYKGGELLNRRFSFATSFREQFGKAKAGFDVDDVALGSVLDRSNNLMLNMSKANRAAWQRGALSLTFQFNQVSQKAMESVLGLNGNFTAAERWKIMAGQVGLYGAAGVPLGSMGAHWLMEALGYDTQLELEQELGPEMVKLVNEGFLGWLTMTMLNADLEIGPDSSLAQGIENIIDDLFFEERNFSELVLGAFGSVSNNFWEGLTQVPKKLSFASITGNPVDYVKAIGSPFLNSLSFTRNIDRAIFMDNFDKIINRSGQTIAQNFTDSEKFYQAMGFRTRREADYYRGRIQIDARKEYLNTVSENMVNLYYQAAALSLKGELSDSQLDEISAVMGALMYDLNPYEESTVRERVKNNLYSTDTLEGQMWDEYRRYNAEGGVNNLMRWSRLLEGNFSQMRNLLQQGGVLREGVYDEAQGANN